MTLNDKEVFVTLDYCVEGKYRIYNRVQSVNKWKLLGGRRGELGG